MQNRLNLFCSIGGPPMAAASFVSDRRFLQTKFFWLISKYTFFTEIITILNAVFWKNKTKKQKAIKKEKTNEGIKIDFLFHWRLQEKEKERLNDWKLEWDRDGYGHKCTLCIYGYGIGSWKIKPKRSQSTWGYYLILILGLRIKGY